MSARRKVQSATRRPSDNGTCGQSGDRRDERHRGPGMVHHHPKVTPALQVSRLQRIRERSERGDRQHRPRRINRRNRPGEGVRGKVRAASGIAENVGTGRLVKLLRDLPLEQVGCGITGEFALVGEARRCDGSGEEHHGLGVRIV